MGPEGPAGARLHITARAAGGHRRQLLLPYPWESDQLEAIRDGVVKLYGDFQEGVPLEQAIAELSAAMAEAQSSRDTPSTGRTCGVSTTPRAKSWFCTPAGTATPTAPT